MSSSQPGPTQNGQRAGLPLRRLLLGLTLLTVAAAAEKVVGLSAPMPSVEAPSRLSLDGYRISALQDSAPRRGRDLSLGTMRHFRLVPLSGEPAIALRLLPVSSRMGRDLNMDAIGGVAPSLALPEKRIVYLEVANATGPAPKADSMNMGRGPGDPAGSTTRLQTCLTPTGQAAVESYMLEGEGKAPGKLGLRPADLPRLIGLQQARHGCLAVQLESGASAGGQGGVGSVDRQRQLKTVWKNLRGLLIGSGEGA